MSVFPEMRSTIDEADPDCEKSVAYRFGAMNLFQTF
jgi:hypothetical protein